MGCDRLPGLGTEAPPEAASTAVTSPGCKTRFCFHSSRNLSLGAPGKGLDANVGAESNSSKECCCSQRMQTISPLHTGSGAQLLPWVQLRLLSDEPQKPYTGQGEAFQSHNPVHVSQHSRTQTHQLLRKEQCQTPQGGYSQFRTHRVLA